MEAKMDNPFESTAAKKKINIIYEDGNGILAECDGYLFFSDGESSYEITSQPYEPCTYFVQNEKVVRLIHNAFTTDEILMLKEDGAVITAITGTKYDKEKLCRLFGYVSKHLFECDIGYAEELAGIGKGGEVRKRAPKPELPSERVRVTGMRELADDPFYTLLEEYDTCLDFCIIKSDEPYKGLESHKKALLFAMEQTNELYENQWKYDIGIAKANEKDTKEFLLETVDRSKFTYSYAFLIPPYGIIGFESDFKKINSALFPFGADGLTVYEWSTDWSDYFDDGHEWWGAACWTVYDKKLDRYTVILASATD